MTPRQRRIAQLITARNHLDQQIRLLDGDRPARNKGMTPAEIRSDAETVRVRAKRRYRDSDETLATRRTELLADNARWVDYRTRDGAA